MPKYIILYIAILGTFILLLIITIVKMFAKPQKISKFEKLLKAGKNSTIIKKIKPILAKNPNNWEARNILAKAYLANHQIEQALKEFRTVSKSAVFKNATQEIEVRNIISDLFFKFHQYDIALEEFAILIKLSPKNPTYLFKTGQIFEHRNITHQAKSYYAMAIDADSRYAEAYAALGLIFYREKKLADAEESISQALKIEPTNTTAMYYHGKILRGKKDFAYALKAFEDAAKSPELRVKSYVERGCCYMEANNPEKAIFELTRAIRSSKDPESQEIIYARYFLATCYEKERQFEKAIEQWEKIYRLNPKFKNIETKLNEYGDIKTNDQIKEYLTSSSSTFIKIAKSVAQQIFKLGIKEANEIHNGCKLLAYTKETEQWMNVRTRAYLLYFLRGDKVIPENYLREAHEKMKSKAIDKIYIISSSGFSQPAYEFANNRPFELIDKSKLSRILKQTTLKL